MQPWMSDVPAAIVRVKAELRKSVRDLEARFRTLTAQLEREVAAVVQPLPISLSWLYRLLE